jgi:hypothetical protein
MTTLQLNIYLMKPFFICLMIINGYMHYYNQVKAKNYIYFYQHN